MKIRKKDVIPLLGVAATAASVVVGILLLTRKDEPDKNSLVVQFPPSPLIGRTLYSARPPFASPSHPSWGSAPNLV